METDSPVVYHGTSESRFPPEQIRRSQIQLSQDEIRLLRECNKESFYYRCLPFAIAGIAATFLGVKQGYLKAHPKWGPAGKMTGAAFVGWFVGKFSYRSICEEKFLKLENSAVGDAVRKRRGYVSETFESEKSQKFPDEDLSLRDNYTSFGKDSDFHSSSGSLNLDVDKNVTYSGLDDRERPSTDRESLNFDSKDEPIRKFTTYEELRRRNREEYERQHNHPQQKSEPSQSTGVLPKQWNQLNEPPKRFASSQYEGGSKNAYGDTWDNPKFQ